MPSHRYGFLITPLLLVGILAGNDVPLRLESPVRTELPFALPIDPATCRDLLGELPQRTIAIDTAALRAQLIDQIGEATPDGWSGEAAATILLRDDILPVLKNEVARFNRKLHDVASDEEIATGLLLWDGLVEGLTARVPVGAACILATYAYEEGSFNTGSWRLPSSPAIQGTSSTSRSATVKIDKTFTCDLTPFGHPATVDLVVRCTGTVTLKQSLGYTLLDQRPQGPRNTLRIRPWSDVTASRTVEAPLFTVSDREPAQRSQRIEHGAILEGLLQAEPWVDDRP